MNRKIASNEEIQQIENAIRNKSARNTNRSYDTGIGQFGKFCFERGINPKEATPEAIAVWVNEMNNKGKKLNTIRARLSAVSGYFSKMGMDSPTRSKIITDMLQGLIRMNFEGSELTAPISIAQLTEVCENLYLKNDPRSIQERALLSIGFFGAFRVMELASIKMNHIDIKKNRFTIMIERSKDLKVGDINVKAFTRKSPESICPVIALNDIISIRPDDFDFLFPTVYKSGKIVPSKIQRKTFTGVIKEYFGKKYSSHSLRVGFVTEARRRKATIPEIQNQTGHKVPHMVNHYTRYIDAFEGNAEDRF